jgi:hypothetical protein
MTLDCYPRVLVWTWWKTPLYSQSLVEVHLSFSTATGTSADISINNTVVSVSKLPMCPLDLEAHILGRYEEENAPAGILFRSGLLVMWNCTPSLLLSQSLSALGLRFS